MNGKEGRKRINISRLDDEGQYSKYHRRDDDRSVSEGASFPLPFPTTLILQKESSPTSFRRFFRGKKEAEERGGKKTWPPIHPPGKLWPPLLSLSLAITPEFEIFPTIIRQLLKKVYRRRRTSRLPLSLLIHPEEEEDRKRPPHRLQKKRNPIQANFQLTGGRRGAGTDRLPSQSIT